MSNRDSTQTVEAQATSKEKDSEVITIDETVKTASIASTTTTTTQQHQQKPEQPSDHGRMELIRRKLAHLMIYVVSIAQFIASVMNGSAMTVALVDISKSLGFDNYSAQWIMSSYIVTFGGFLLLAGRVGDMYGHRNVFLIGQIWFGLWTMFCVTRALQGIGASMSVPTALGLITTTLPAGPKRTRALSIFGGFGAAGAVNVMGYTSMQTSLEFLAHSIATIVAFTILGKILPKYRSKPFVLAGFAFRCVAAIMFSFVTDKTSYWTLPFLGLLVHVAGLGASVLPAQITALKDAQNEDQGVVGAMYSTGMQLGAPLGLAIVTVISENSVNLRQDGANEQNVSMDLLIQSYRNGLFGVAGLGVLGIIVCAFMMPNNPPTPAPAAPVTALDDLEPIRVDTHNQK
ncbi:hypothetical protein BGZ65_002868 [Modicella reniformis]|uniref:Major facilitator superfamily (MFS) profile domain-containing protein n=1 Tax=Modicella reniformis TaxID=1440133 RepID=A0A9P6J0P9_9FUNG|nr:hypothetical protein BGZ65_002868 [Modicella reniformis]